MERNLYWVTDGTYQSAFLTTRDGVVLFDAPPTIGHNLQRAIDEIASANGVPNKVTHLVYSHHHADHLGASSLFGRNVVPDRARRDQAAAAADNDPARPVPDVTFEARYTLHVGGERIDLAWHGTNHTPDNSYIHFPDHDTLMLVDIVNCRAGCRSTASTSTRTSPAPSPPRPRPWPTRGSTSSAATWAGSAPATT